jgi:hypothetical protein
MAWHPLRAHPSAPPALALALEAQPGGGASDLALDFRLEGDISRLRFGNDRGRQDGLWLQTCFEAFLAPVGAAGYLEFNFTPSGAWAAYEFEARRLGMRALDLPRPPVIAAQRGGRGLDLTVQFSLPRRAAAWRLGLAAVLEDELGAKSYWALDHGGSEPDFHDPAGFRLEIPGA